MKNIPNLNTIFPNEYKTSCFVKNVITAPNIHIGDYTYYDDSVDSTGFEKNNVLFNYPEFGDQLIIGKFCSIASGTKFIMGPANHRMSSVTTYPFQVFGGLWSERTPDHMSQLPFNDELIELLLRLQWWDVDSDDLVEFLPVLCDLDLDKVTMQIEKMLMQKDCTK